MDIGKPILSLEDVTLRRGDDVLLDGVSWTVREGQHWAVLGANGSGKTCMLRIATGYLWASEGKVTCLGHPAGSHELRDLRMRIGWASSALDPMIRTGNSAQEIILSGAFAATGLFETPTDLNAIKCEKLMELLHLTEVQDRRWHLLSLGEQRKTLLARSLMLDPELLILDEPCVGLDIPSREIFLDTLLHIHEPGFTKSAKSLVYVTHHVEELLSIFTHVVILKHGKILTAGPIADTLTSDVLTEAYDIPVEIEREHGRFWTRVKPH
ncbi:MAG: ATP-binding cassette domain-containing protein [Phycisphaerales bacterium]|nr:ATP-binding cassette domain-containing protein [Phycisphaerales bacterium]MBT7170885.1 ATP-binding cassette domain-containing protein [Phycisphaerales bacterium]